MRLFLTLLVFTLLFAGPVLAANYCQQAREGNLTQNSEEPPWTIWKTMCRAQGADRAMSWNWNGDELNVNCRRSSGSYHSSFLYATCPVSCPDGWDPNTNGCAPEPVDCSGHTGSRGYHGTGGLAAMPDEICSGGCAYRTSGPGTFPVGLADGSWHVIAPGTGQACAPGSPEKDPIDPASHQGGSSHEAPTTTTSSEPPVTETDTPNPGDTTTTNETTTTEQDPGGRSVTTTATDISMTQQGDATTTTKTTTTTTTHPDGSTNITKTTETTTQKNSGWSVTLHGADGSVTEVTSPGFTTTGTTTTTTNIGADGSVTSTTSSTGDTNGNGQEGDEGLDWTPGPRGQFSDQSQAVADARQGLLDAINQVKGEAGELFSPFSQGSSTLPCWYLSVWGNSYSLCLGDHADALNLIAIAILLISLLVAFHIILR